MAHRVRRNSALTSASRSAIAAVVAAIIDHAPLLRSLVRKLSSDVFECVDGTEALATYREHQPDWVLMDHEMPQMNGMSVPGRMRTW